MKLQAAHFDRETRAIEVVYGRDSTGKRAIVTGASSGIGIETARALASCGCSDEGLHESGPDEVNFALADGVVVQTRQYVGIETVGSVRNAAGDQGFGYFALSSNARAGREFPMVALHSVLQNGSSRR